MTTLRRTAYLLASLPVGLTAFIVVVVLATTGIGLSPVVGGLFVLVAAATTAGWFADLERRMQHHLLGRHLAPAHRPASGERTRPGLARLRERQTWLDIVWVVLRFGVSVVTASLTIAWLGLTLAVPVTLLEMALPQLYPEHFFRFGTWQPSDAVIWTIQFAVGCLAVGFTPVVVGALSGVQAHLAETLLSGEGDLAARIESLTASRDAARHAEADQLRRLERDIHDGPQQRLVRLGMDLARAERALSDESGSRDPQKAAQILAESRQRTAETLHELRSLSRRVSPPLLVDRGLAAAIAELASQSLVPVSIDVLDARLPAHIESAAYFVISEALANVNKHAGASRVEVVVGQVEGNKLQVVVQDDGCGGADVSKGHGLAGLQSRVRGVDGTLEVTSPPGGPTIVQALVPCES